MPIELDDRFDYGENRWFGIGFLCFGIDEYLRELISYREILVGATEVPKVSKVQSKDGQRIQLNFNIQSIA